MDTKCPKCNTENPSDSKYCQECNTPLSSSEKIYVSETRTRRTPPKDVAPGEVIDKKYKLIEELGKGGMGVVYKAEQIKPVKRTVALKIIKLGMDTHQIVARFETERQALALMDHPNIAKVFDAGATERGRPYFAMEFIRGMSITEYCDKHRLSTGERLKLFIPLCLAVQHAHQKGLIHRDLKPSNVLVAVQDDKPVPKIIDFGIAKATDHRLTQRTLFTEEGQFIGTPEYMSPEQAEMSRLDVDTRTDIYSLAVMLYELLVGVLPFDPQALRSAGFGEIQRIIREDEPPRASTRLSGLGDTQTSIAEQRRTDVASLYKQLKSDLDWITMKGMEKDRTQRYASASELAADIERHLRHEPIMASPPSTLYKLKKYMKRHKVGVAAAMLVTAAILLGSTLATIGMIQASRERDRAQKEAIKAQTINEFLQEVLVSPDPYRRAGRKVTVLEALQSAKEKIETYFTGQPQVEATAKNAIGELYRRLGSYDEADSLLTSSLEIRKKLFGHDHLEIAESLFNLASLFHDRSEHNRAETMYHSALEMRRRLLGPEHPDVALSINTLARLYRSKGDLDKAEAWFREALGLRKKLFGEEHADVAETLSDLALLLMIKRDHDEAEVLYRKSLAINRRLFGEYHPAVASNLSGLGSVLQEKGDYDAAETLYRQALEIRRRVFGERHWDVASSLVWLGHLLKAKGDYDQAERKIREGLSIYRDAFGEDHEYVGTTLLNLAVLFRDKGDYKKAEPLYREALEIYKLVLEPGHWLIENTRSSYGACLTKLGRFAEAEDYLLNSYSGLKRIFGADHNRAVWVVERLVQLYESWGRPKKAAEYRALLKKNDLEK
jgi:serine/threonine protein kinase/Tfp pilus assembly protein PilF